MFFTGCSNNLYAQNNTKITTAKKKQKKHRYKSKRYSHKWKWMELTDVKLGL